ncbi:hypothetical protein BN59_01865 [Legionella massiliensis]|uniref:Uncharacterized protein n=1 Tax=Legionella massiliensis TaxID=1034943 RepID=A0A078KX77_9GAMM|nr:hypothetical protein BN59_01865 [Legionella massiliensis]CEE13319.1 hypothetical protein BN1094_01865 [Legionella massiliensis]
MLNSILEYLLSLSLFRHQERREGVRHVERRETSPECGTLLIPEIPHYVRDDEVFLPQRGWSALDDGLR